jgi:tetratricopeptide (TPR) repeat protein
MKKISFIVVLVSLAFHEAQAQNCNRYVDGDSTKTTAPYSIYREFFKKNLYAEALPQWRIIFEKAPAFRAQTFMDGEVMFTSLVQNTTDKALKEKYIDTLFLIYDKRAECHGFADYVYGKKAVDLIKYRNDIKGALPILEKSLALGGNNAYPFVIQTYYKVLANQLGRTEADLDLLIKKHEDLTKIVDYNIAKPNNKQLQAYIDVKNSLDDLFAEFTDKSDPEDAAKLFEIYKNKYAAAPNDVEVIKQVYNKLFVGKNKIMTDSSFYIEVLEKLNKYTPSYSYAVRLGNIYMKENKMDSAFVLYANALKTESDSTKIADLNFIMANIKYEKNDFPAARDFAKQALQYNPRMGRAYLLIGVLYAASGKLCGPGTGFQSQIVLWPAFDYFNQAIEHGQDEVATEAQKMISTYTEFLPTKAELLKKKLSVGSAYTVECWINEQTTVKAR